MVYEAVVLRYIPATDTQGTMLSARMGEVKMVEPMRYGMDLKDQYLQLAEKLIQEQNWVPRPYRTIMGSLPDNGYVCVVEPMEETSTNKV